MVQTRFGIDGFTMNYEPNTMNLLSANLIFYINDANLYLALYIF